MSCHVGLVALINYKSLDLLSNYQWRESTQITYFKIKIFVFKPQ